MRPYGPIPGTNDGTIATPPAPGATAAASRTSASQPSPDAPPYSRSRSQLRTLPAGINDSQRYEPPIAWRSQSMPRSYWPRSGVNASSWTRSISHVPVISTKASSGMPAAATSAPTSQSWPPTTTSVPTGRPVCSAATAVTRPIGSPGWASEAGSSLDTPAAARRSGAQSFARRSNAIVVDAEVGSVRISPQSRNATMSGTMSHVAASSA